MSEGFGKVFAGLYEGSMLGAGVHVFALWPYCLARANAKGVVEVNARLAAHVLGCSIPEIESALDYLQRPDPESRSQAEEGRRLVREGQFAYRIVNYQRYRDIRDAEARREYQRDWVREKRTGRHESTDIDSRQASTMSPKEEAEAEAEAEAGREARSAPSRAFSPRRKPTEKEWVDYCGATWPEWELADVLSAWGHYEARGWKSITNWHASARTCRHKWTPGGGGRAARPAPPLPGAHPPAKAQDRPVDETSPSWVRAIHASNLNPLRPAVPDELEAALLRWIAGADEEEPERWEMDLEAALDEARKLDRPVNLARGMFGRRK